MDRVARSEGVALPPGATLCDLAMALVQHCLGPEEPDALPIVAKRSSVNDAATTWNSGLFEVEEALGCLHHDDHKDFVEARKKAKACASASELPGRLPLARRGGNGKGEGQGQELEESRPPTA